MDKFTINDLDLYYGSFKALKSVNLKIAPNEVTAFIGPHERPGGGLQDHRGDPL